MTETKITDPDRSYMEYTIQRVITDTLKKPSKSRREQYLIRYFVTCIHEKIYRIQRFNDVVRDEFRNDSLAYEGEIVLKDVFEVGEIDKVLDKIANAVLAQFNVTVDKIEFVKHADSKLYYNVKFQLYDP